MTRPPITHILFDFFGTLVDYSASMTEQGYHQTHRLLVSLGVCIDYSEFVESWSAEARAFDERSAIDESEFSMGELSKTFLARFMRRAPERHEIDAFVNSYLREWNTGVVYPSTTANIVSRLADYFRLAVVTNTHQLDLVPNHLVAMNIAKYFATVVTSVEVGWRKPHPAIYAEAFDRLRITAAEAAFVGDTYTADYAGPIAVGMAAFLIDPNQENDIPAEGRLRSLSELPDRLRLARRY
jgi:putative hydrolase of the HAD superfamily